MDKEFLGQPAWLWAAGAAVIIGGYLYIRSKSSKQQAAPAGGGGGGKYSSTSTVHETITDLQSNPKPPKKKTGTG